MGLITIKKKSNEPIKESDSKFKKLWKDPKSHALMVLGFYLVFFIIIFIFLALSKPNSTADKENEDKIKNMFSNLEEKQNLTYNYIIKTDNYNYLFNGSQDATNAITGKLIADDKNIQIKIENNECVVGLYDENNEFIQSEDLCPENIDYKYFNLKNIYDLIKDEKLHKNINSKYYDIKINEDTKFEIHYKTENNEEELSKIIIKGNNQEYELTYKEV